mmetsp:Transcript_18549/g.74054  ORF Transcript_18549/g.74054 Transcript_18549/m.74054 type:complete len:293 (-) Transcript_18549:55-933(-)
MQGYGRALGYEPHKAMGPAHSMGYSYEKDFLPFAKNATTVSALSNLTAAFGGDQKYLLFNDFPFYAVPCQLAIRYPAAKFVAMRRRSCGEWADSALEQLFCGWMRAQCNTTRFRTTHPDVGFQTTRWFIDTFDRGLVDGMCRSTTATCLAHHAPLEREKTLDRLTNVCERHYERVRACVPPDRLLEVVISENASSVAGIAPFLGCSEADGAAAARQWNKQGRRGARPPNYQDRLVAAFSAGLARSTTLPRQTKNAHALARRPPRSPTSQNSRGGATRSSSRSSRRQRRRRRL